MQIDCIIENVFDCTQKNIYNNKSFVLNNRKHGLYHKEYKMEIVIDYKVISNNTKQKSVVIDLTNNLEIQKEKMNYKYSNAEYPFLLLSKNELLMLKVCLAIRCTILVLPARFSKYKTK